MSKFLTAMDEIRQDRRFGLAASSQSKPPVLQFVAAHGYWRCWTAYDPSLTHGTYFALYEDGSILRVTVRPDGTEDIATL